jgi:hypothetical protein
MRLAVDGLHSSSARSVSQIAEIVSHGERLRDDLSAARESFRAGELFADTVVRARGMLDRMGATHASVEPGDVHDAHQAALEDLTRRYTMQSERDVHDGLATPSPAEDGPPTEQSALDPPAGEASELGDNVEFF